MTSLRKRLSRTCGRGDEELTAVEEGKD